MALTQSQVREMFSYDPETGLLTWVSGYRGVQVGRTAGALTARGYIGVIVHGKKYQAHRLIWLYVHGHFPPKWQDIDHANQIKHDNRLSNLRLSSRSQNQANVNMYSSNTTGYKGVSWHKQREKFRASIRHNYKSIHLGVFDTAEEASDAYKAAAQKIYGEFAA